jgi:hypothetical protein
MLGPKHAPQRGKALEEQKIEDPIPDRVAGEIERLMDTVDK